MFKNYQVYKNTTFIKGSVFSNVRKIIVLVKYAGRKSSQSRECLEIKALIEKLIVEERGL